jgi:uncharacterized protein YyaL (SSP411 family)
MEAFVELALAEQGLFLERAPQAFPTLLRALAIRHRGLAVAVIVGAEGAPGTNALADRARRVLRPEDAVLVVAPEAAVPAGVSPHWLAGRKTIDGQPTAYLCHGRSCSLPIHDPTDLVAELELQPPSP